MCYELLSLITYQNFSSQLWELNQSYCYTRDHQTCQRVASLFLAFYISVFCTQWVSYAQVMWFIGGLANAPPPPPPLCPPPPYLLCPAIYLAESHQLSNIQHLPCDSPNPITLLLISPGEVCVTKTNVSGMIYAPSFRGYITHYLVITQNSRHAIFHFIVNQCDPTYFDFSRPTLKHFLGDSSNLWKMPLTRNSVTVSLDTEYICL